MLTRIKKIVRDKDVIIISGLILATIALRVTMLSLYPIPVPYIQDEQANMLGAQTFSLGRLTNPPLLFPDSLREIHVLSQPTRMMKYQPGTALFMALGIVVFGHAYWGIVISIALFVGSTYWAVKGWSNRTIGLLIALFFLTAFRAPHYFMQSYWGGAVSMLGAMLVLGAYPRLFFTKQFRCAYLGMIGVVLLAISRPYEAIMLLLGLAIPSIYIFTASFSRQEKYACLRHVFPALLLIGGSYLIIQAYYNSAVTLHGWKLPYISYQEQYGITPTSLGGTVHSELFSTHPVLNTMQRWELDTYKHKKITNTILSIISGSLHLLGMDRLDPFLPIALIACVTWIISIYIFPLYWFIKSSKTPQLLSTAPLLWAWGFVLISVHLIIGMQPHYLGVLVAVLCMFIAIQCERWMAAKKNPRFAYGILFALIGCYGLMTSNTYPGPQKHLQHKATITAKLLAKGEKSLVFVDETKDIDAGIIHESWVYNAPDLDSAPIIWAWYLSPEENAKLIAYYPHRHTWYIDSSKPLQLIPYGQQ